MADYRLFLKHTVPSLLFLDSRFYVSQEVQKSKEIFKGRLTQDLLKSRLGSLPESHAKRLALDSCGLCHYDREFNLK